jgi:hypothetical protein
MKRRRRRTRTAEEFSHAERSQAAADFTPPEPRIADASADRAGSFNLGDILEKVSLVIAPPTLIAALAFWFGWTMTNARSAYFGIDSSILGFSTTDYVLRSADAAFVPIAIVLLAVLIAIVLHGLVRHAVMTGRGPKAVRRAAIGGVMLGAFLTFFGVWAMFEPLPMRTSYLVPPVILGLGPSLIAYSGWTLRYVTAANKKEVDRIVPMWERSGYVIAVALALLGVFWASSLYASALGRGRAEVLAGSLSSRPAVTVFSVKSLDINAAGVTVTRITADSSEYKFRYSGLRLLIRSANKYFLVNESWSRERGVTIVLQDTPDIRLEFAPGG